MHGGASSGAGAGGAAASMASGGVGGIGGASGASGASGMQAMSGGGVGGVSTLDASQPDGSMVSMDATDGAQLDTGTGNDAMTGTRAFPSDRMAFGLGGASHCDRADVLLCDGFESGAIDDATWSLETWGSGSASIESTIVARGSHSVRIEEPADVSRVMLRETKTFASTGNHFFGRFFLYLPYTSEELMCPNGNCTNLVHWTATSAGGDFMQGGDTFRPDVRAVGAVNQRLLLNLDGGPTPEVGIDDSDAPAGYDKLDDSHINQWMCFEFEYAGEGESAEVRVWWDGFEHPGLHYSTDRRGDRGELWAIPKYDYLEFGFTHYQNYGDFTPSFTAYLDEIAVDDERIGCAL